MPQIEVTWADGTFRADLDDDTKIEELMALVIGKVTPEAQAAINAKYGTPLARAGKATTREGAKGAVKAIDFDAARTAVNKIGSLADAKAFLLVVINHLENIVNQ